MSAICDAHKKKVDVELLYNLGEDRMSTSWGSDELERRCWNEEHVPEKLGPQAPGWAAQKNRKETRLWPIEWGSICCSPVRSPTPSHTQPFQIKWQVYFSKELCHSSLLCRCVMHTDVYVLCGYTTHFFTYKQFYFKQFSLNVKEVLFQAIQFSICTQFCSIWPIDRTISGATTPDQSGPGSDGNKVILYIPQSSNITLLNRLGL